MSGMTEPERAASQREVDILRNRIEQIDASGSRGVGVLMTQVGELVKDMADMRAETRTWQGQHERHHEQDARDRIAGRRWLIGVGVAGVASMAAMLGLLVDIAGHLHG